VRAELPGNVRPRRRLSNWGRIDNTQVGVVKEEVELCKDAAESGAGGGDEGASTSYFFPLTMPSVSLTAQMNL